MSEQSTTMKDRITIKGRDGAFGAYIARPKALPAPAVVVLHEVFLNQQLRRPPVVPAVLISKEHRDTGYEQLHTRNSSSTIR